MATGRELAAKLEPFFKVSDAVLRWLPATAVVALYALVRGWPGPVGIGVRYVCARRLLKTCGSNVRIGPNCTIVNWSGISVGNNVSLHVGCYLDGLGTITIGDDVSIAHGCSVLSFEHTWMNATKPIKYNPMTSRAVSIGSDVWVGCGVRILGGTVLSDRSVIGAGAVLNGKYFGPGLIVGVPGRHIRNI